MINQPMEDVRLPENLEKAIEQAKNRVTEYDSEAKRLKALAEKSNYEVGELHKKKVELEEQISALEIAKNRLDSEITTLRDILTTYQDQKAQFEEDKRGFDTVTTEFRGQQQAFLAQKEVFNKEIEEKEARIREKEQALAVKIDLYDNKLKAIDDLRASI